MKHFLKLMDLSEKEIVEILNLADQLKYEKKYGIEHHYLKGKTLGMIFQKSSTRTIASSIPALSSFNIPQLERQSVQSTSIIANIFFILKPPHCYKI